MSHTDALALGHDRAKCHRLPAHWHGADGRVHWSSLARDDAGAIEVHSATGAKGEGGVLPGLPSGSPPEFTTPTPPSFSGLGWWVTPDTLAQALDTGVLMHAVNRDTVGFDGGAAADGAEIRRRLVAGMVDRLGPPGAAAIPRAGEDDVHRVEWLLGPRSWAEAAVDAGALADTDPRGASPLEGYARAMRAQQRLATALRRSRIVPDADRLAEITLANDRALVELLTPVSALAPAVVTIHHGDPDARAAAYNEGFDDGWAQASAGDTEADSVVTPADGAPAGQAEDRGRGGAEPDEPRPLADVARPDSTELEPPPDFYVPWRGTVMASSRGGAAGGYIIPAELAQRMTDALSEAPEEGRLDAYNQGWREALDVAIGLLGMALAGVKGKRARRARRRLLAELEGRR